MNIDILLVGLRWIPIINMAGHQWGPKFSIHIFNARSLSQNEVRMYVKIGMGTELVPLNKSSRFFTVGEGEGATSGNP